MSNVLYPSTARAVGYPVKKWAEWNVLVSQAVSGYESRITQWTNPIWHWELLYEVLFDDPNNIPAGLTDTDFRTLLGFYCARNGSFDDFLYSDPTDNSVTNQTLQLVQDTVTGNWYSPIQRLLGGTGGFYEDITDLVTGSLTIYAGGTATSGYTLVGPGLAINGHAWEGLVASWGATEPATPVTATFQFYFRVRFMDPDHDPSQQGGGSFFQFENFASKLWETKVIDLISARRSPQIWV